MLSRQLNAADFYRGSADEIKTVTERAETIPQEIEAAFARWANLDSLTM